MSSAPDNTPDRNELEHKAAHETDRPARLASTAPSQSRLRSEAHLRDEAWIGDAVLTLYARLKILREDGTLNGEKAMRMTSNQFLAAFGEPTAVEAAIGRVFEHDGLAAAFVHIETLLIPLFTKQEEKRLRRAGKSTH